MRTMAQGTGEARPGDPSQRSRPRTGRQQDHSRSDYPRMNLTSAPPAWYPVHPTMRVCLYGTRVRRRQPLLFS